MASCFFAAFMVGFVPTSLVSVWSEAHPSSRSSLAEHAALPVSHAPSQEDVIRLEPIDAVAGLQGTSQEDVIRLGPIDAIIDGLPRDDMLQSAHQKMLDAHKKYVRDDDRLAAYMQNFVAQAKSKKPQ